MANKIKDVAEESPAVAKNLYHFPGEMIWQPQAVEAASLVEAQEIWEKTKKLIN